MPYESLMIHLIRLASHTPSASAPFGAKKTPNEVHFFYIFYSPTQIPKSTLHFYLLVVHFYCKTFLPKSTFCFSFILLSIVQTLWNGPDLVNLHTPLSGLLRVRKLLFCLHAERDGEQILLHLFFPLDHISF